MKLLHYFFNIIWPNNSKGNNWLSIHFSKWFFERRRKQYREFENWVKPEDSDNYHVFFGGDIGQGIAISESFNWNGANRIGFSVALDYGIWGYTHTVLGRREAKRMAEFILQRLATEPQTEEDQLTEEKKKFEKLKEKLRIEQSA